MKDEYEEDRSFNQGDDWLTGTLKRNPEALLVLAAGAALLLRRGTSVGAYASTAASTAAGYAGAGQRRIGKQAKRVRRRSARLGRQARSAAGEMLHEQPLAVAALGLAAGAAVAALLPRTDIEDRTFGPARDDLFEAAGRTAGMVAGAASEAGRRLQEGAADRGLSAEGLKTLAQEAAEGFSDGMAKSVGDEGGGNAGGGAGA